MKVDLQGKTVAITGAGGAIGRAMAIRFAENGAKVAVCDIHAPSGQETADIIQVAGNQAKFFSLDVTDSQCAKQVIQDIVSTFGTLDMLINNAGVNVGPSKRFPIHQFDDEQWERIVAIDLKGVYVCSKAAIPYIIQNKGGNIINISSVVGIIPFRNQCAFTAAKAGVINLTKAMALELASENIRVNAIAPGSICMDLTKSLWADEAVKEAFLSHIPQHRQGSPDDIAYAALYLACDQASYVTGNIMTVDGGWTCGFARDF